jgi:hypothetical protein
MEKPIDRNDLAYWFPRLAAAGVAVPRTEIVRTEIDLARLCEGREPPGYAGFLGDLSAACLKIGLPCFLRTGHTSNKHDWKASCHLAGIGDLPRHVDNLVEFSELADILGLPTGTWAVRELVPLRVGFTAFNGMPVAMERRWFLRDGGVLCDHPYWPAGAIRDASDPRPGARLIRMELAGITREHRAAQREIAGRVAAAFDGAWSLDLALAEDGRWYAIDMAEMDRSYHWPGCEFGPESGA